MYQLPAITFPHDLSEFSEIIDVRSPSEYETDHLPNAINLPVLTDAERIEVGKLYKKNPFEARRVGAAFISANVAKHLETHLSTRDAEYKPLLYCWRGGMRSRSMAFILHSIGWKTHIVNGGYRAFRQFIAANLIELLEDDALDLKVLSGLTGVGKTRLLKAIEESGGQILDLEGLANHKGSLLGASPDSEQPSQKRFESQLWDTLNQLDFSRPIYTEAESNRIGNIHCPVPLWKALAKAKVLDVVLPLNERIKLLREEYPHFEEDIPKLSAQLSHLTKLRGHAQIDEWRQLSEKQEWDAFVESLLTNHYDLCYRQPGHEKSNYQAASETVHVSDSHYSSYLKTAKTLLKSSNKRISS